MWKVSRIHCMVSKLNAEDDDKVKNILTFFFCSDLFKKETLEFFSKTLPILKADDTLPKVAKYEDSHISYNSAIFDSKPVK